MFSGLALQNKRVFPITAMKSKSTHTLINMPSDCDSNIVNYRDTYEMCAIYSDITAVNFLRDEIFNMIPKKVGVKTTS